MTLQKSAQKKAQQEIDTVIGNNRFPNLQDREHLPYVNAMLTEVLRFYTFMPVGRLKNALVLKDANVL